MASDDNETRKSSPAAKVVGRPSGRWLALVPVSIAVVTFALMVPRAAPPDDVPLPAIDARALAAIENDDAARAAAARAERLPDDVLAVGTALRAYQKHQARGDSDETTAAAKATLDHATAQLLARDGKREAILDQLKTLRAVQLEVFLAEVARFEATGARSEELEELGGTFLERMRAAGWTDGNQVLLTDAERRAAFKTVWTAIVLGPANTELAPALDEQRALYTLYLRRPHPPEMQRAGFVAQRARAGDPAECARVVTAERLAAEVWRAEKIRRLADIDPSYPAGYALGVAYYRAGRYEQSFEAFRNWVDAHPDGPWALRAKNHMKAALTAYGP